MISPARLSLAPSVAIGRWPLVIVTTGSKDSQGFGCCRLSGFTPFFIAVPHKQAKLAYPESSVPAKGAYDLPVARSVPSSRKRNAARYEVVFVGMPFQFLAEIRMRDGDNRFRAFRDGLSL